MKKVYLSSPVHEECPSYYTLRIRLAPQGTGFHDVPVVRIVERIHWTKLRKQHTYYVPPYASVMMFSHIETCESLEMCGETVPIHNPVSVLPLVKGVLVTDARSLFDVIQKGPGMAVV